MKLVFVYLADSDLKSSILDVAHKILSPKTYACHLCKLTHGAFSEKQNWRDYLKTSKIDFQFLHRDEFEREHKLSLNYPVVLKELNHEFETLLNADEIQEFRSELDLIAFLKKLEEKFD